MNLSGRTVLKAIFLLVTSPVWIPAVVIGIIAKVFWIGLKVGYTMVSDD